MTMWYWLIAIASAYLIGSIPFGVMLGRMKGIDIRAEGSRNIGATNVARVLGKRLGLLCFVLDMLKGAVPVGAAGVFFGLIAGPASEIDHIEQSQMWWWLAVAAAAIGGHMFSIFLRFGGGKGIATGFGTMVAMSPLLTAPALVALIVWYTALRLFKYVSVASILAASSLPVLCAMWYMENRGGLDDALRGWPVIAATTILAVVVVWKHRGNLARIRRGEEPKVGVRSQPR